jgi:hypothetical protein
MSQAHWAAELTNDAVIYALAASLAFLAFAVLLDPKLFRIPVGRSLIVLDAGLVALYVPSVLHRFFGLNISSLAFAWFYLGVIITVGTAVWVRTWVMIRVQRRRGS